MDAKELIARRVAQEIKNGDIVNLGIGLPTSVAKYIGEKEVFFQSENGLIGIKGVPTEEEIDFDLVDAGGKPITATEEACFFDSATSFGIIRGGHVDITVLGSLQVDKEGSIANWIIPQKLVPGMGGAMDLLVGAKRVIVAMTHTAKGSKKILEQCTLPLTARKEVNTIITELGVIDVTEDGLLLKEIAEGITVEEIQNQTEARLIIDKNLKIMNV